MDPGRQIQKRVETPEQNPLTITLAHTSVVERPTAYMDAMERNKTNEFRPWMGRIRGRVGAIAHGQNTPWH